MPPRTEPP